MKYRTHRQRRCALYPLKRRGFALFNLVSVIALCWGAMIPVALAEPCDDEFVSAPGPLEGEFFGKAMALDGRTAVIGAPGVLDGKSDIPGRAFVFEWKNGKWKYQATLDSIASVNGDAFGLSVAIHRETIVIGAPRMFNHRRDRTGIVFVYERPTDGWVSTSVPDAVLYDHAGERNDMFGASVAIAGDWILVGAPQDDEEQVDSGSVLVYERDPDLRRGWTQRQRLTRPSPVRREHFGTSLVVDGNWAVIGAPNIDWHTLPGSAHFFKLTAGIRWMHKQTLHGGSTRTPGDHFGRSLSMHRRSNDSNSVLAVGATGTDDRGEHSGAAYLFRYLDRGRGLEWVSEQRVTGRASSKGDHFGFSVSVLSGILVVGAHTFDLRNGINIGAAYGFRYSGDRDRWELKQHMLADCPQLNDMLGFCTILYRNPDTRQLESLLAVPGHDEPDKKDVGSVIRIRNAK